MNIQDVYDAIEKIEQKEELDKLLAVLQGRTIVLTHTPAEHLVPESGGTTSNPKYTISDPKYGLNMSDMWECEVWRIDTGGDLVALIYDKDDIRCTSRAHDFVNAEAYRVENERLRKALKRALELLVDIDSTLFHHNHEVMGWHKNDAGEPIMNFVSDFDMDAIKEIESALSQNT